jgi:PAS domain-containing protein
MATAVPESGWAHPSDDWAGFLGETLDALLELTGAAAGWVSVAGPGGRLAFPVRRGAVPEAWLALQQGRAGAWGVAVRGGPSLVNDLPPLPELGEPPLHNLLACPFRRGGAPAGHLVLGNKPGGFTSYDAVAVQAGAALLGKRLDRAGPAPAALLRRILDRLDEGVLALDEAGRLVFANATWGRWTGFDPADLLGRPPPFPFWVGVQELARGRGPGPGLKGQLPELKGIHQTSFALPFRHRDEAVCWYRGETVTEEAEGRRVRLVFLRPLAGGPPAAEAKPAAAEPAKDGATAAPPDGAEALPLLFRPDGSVDFWDERWLRLTGLAAEDVAGARGGLILDWLFPRQRDRDFVADLLFRPASEGPRRDTQAVLEIAGPAGGQPFLCTFLQVGERPANWLLLARPVSLSGREAPRAGGPERLGAPVESPGPPAAGE